MRGVYQRGHKWAIRYQDPNTGKYVRRVVACNRKTAEVIRGKIIAEITEGRYLDRNAIEPVFFENWASEYLSWSANRKRSHTRDKASFKVLVKIFGGKRLSNITSAMIEAYQAERSKVVSERTVDIEVSFLRLLFNRAVRDGKVERNPVAKVKFFNPDNARQRFLLIDEIERLLKECNSHIRPIVLLALNTGMRQGEMFNLRWCDLDFPNALIHITKSKSGKRRSVPMNAETRELFSRLPRAIDQEAYVFTSGNRKPVKGIRKAFLNACQRAGIEDFTPHDLRHTFASHFVMNGRSLFTLQKILGHSTIRMTERYAHLSDHHMKESVEGLYCAKKSDTKIAPVEK